MSDISNSIRLNDYMSSTLRTINNTMEQTIAIMQRLDTKLHTLGTGGGLNNMSSGLSAVMSRVAMLEGMVASIGTGAGPGAAMFNQLNAQLTVAQTRIAELEAQLAGLGDGPGNSTMLQQLNAQLTASQARIAALEAQLAGLGNGGGGGGPLANQLTAQLNTVRTRVSALQSQLATLGDGSTNPAMFNQFNAQLTQAQARVQMLESQLAMLSTNGGNANIVITHLVNELRRLNTGGGNHANAQIEQLNQQLRTTQRRVEQLEEQLRRLNQGGGSGGSGGGWALRLTGIFSALQMIQMALMAIKGVTDMADEFTNANARLNLINDGLRTQKELQQQVLDVANNTRSSYTATASLVARMGRSGQFRGDNEGAIRFADIVNKSLTISGASTSEASSVILQLSQAMSSGVLRGEEFNAVMENGSRLAEALSTELGVSVGGLRAMAMNGELTADIVADALMNAGEAIDAEFEKMPRTFGQNMEVMRNTFGTWLADMAQAGGALGHLNQLFTDFVTWLMQSSSVFDTVSAILFIVVHLIELLVQGFGLLGQGIDALGPVFDAVVYGVIATSLLYATQLLWGFGAGIAKTIPKILSMGAAWALAHIPIVLIGAAIGILIAILMSFGVSASDIVTFVGGLFGGLVALIGNIAILFMNIFITLAEFLANVFNDPVYAVQLLFYNLVETIIGFLQGLIDGIRQGLNWLLDKVEEVTGLETGNIAEWVLENPLNKPTTDKDMVENDRLDYLSYEDLAKKGSDIANGFLQELGDQSIPMSGGMMPVTDIGTVDKVGKVGKIDDDVNIADEDMKMLMELAVQNRVNQINLTVQTAAPNVTQNNVINTELDLQTAVNDMTTSFYDASQVTVDQDY